MKKKRRDFNRIYGKKRYKRLFIISTEGAVTEPNYFLQIKNCSQQGEVHIKCLQGKTKSSPRQVLKRLKDHLNDNKLSKHDMAWVVIDRDASTSESLLELYEWAQKSNNHGFAISNPKFEFWLLLHFEEGKKALNSLKCSNQLKKHIPNYEKNLDFKMISLPMIHDAIKRGKKYDTFKIEELLSQKSCTVHKLISQLISFA